MERDGEMTWIVFLHLFVVHTICTKDWHYKYNSGSQSLVELSWFPPWPFQVSILVSIPLLLFFSSSNILLRGLGSLELSLSHHPYPLRVRKCFFGHLHLPPRQRPSPQPPTSAILRPSPPFRFHFSASLTWPDQEVQAAGWEAMVRKRWYGLEPKVKLIGVVVRRGVGFLGVDGRWCSGLVWWD